MNDDPRDPRAEIEYCSLYSTVRSSERGGRLTWYGFWPDAYEGLNVGDSRASSERVVAGSLCEYMGHECLNTMTTVGLGNRHQRRSNKCVALCGCECVAAGTGDP